MNDQELKQRLAAAEALLKRVVDKEQAKQELQGFSLFRAPNSLIDAICAFLKQQPAAEPPKEGSDHE